MGKIKKIITADAEQLAAKGAEIVRKTAIEAVSLQGYFAVAISGGSTPRAMHRRLAQDPYLTGVPWQKTHVFMVDERMVAFDQPDSNFGAAQKDFLNKVPIPQEQFHPMPVRFPPEEGAAMYQKELETFFHGSGNPDPRFDLIILGLGVDGHVASLFPGQPVIKGPGRWVLSVKGGYPDVFRLTLNYTVLNSAKHILFLVFGVEKAQILKTLFKDRKASLPAMKIRPTNGHVTWLLDRTAAALL